MVKKRVYSYLGSQTIKKISVGSEESVQLRDYEHIMIIQNRFCGFMYFDGKTNKILVE